MMKLWLIDILFCSTKTKIIRMKRFWGDFHSPFRAEKFRNFRHIFKSQLINHKISCGIISFFPFFFVLYQWLSQYVVVDDVLFLGSFCRFKIYWWSSKVARVCMISRYSSTSSNQLIPSIQPLAKIQTGHLSYCR